MLTSMMVAVRCYQADQGGGQHVGCLHHEKLHVRQPGKKERTAPPNKCQERTAKDNNNPNWDGPEQRVVKTKKPHERGTAEDLNQGIGCCSYAGRFLDARKGCRRGRGRNLDGQSINESYV